jgi:hypothetical protein
MHEMKIKRPSAKQMAKMRRGEKVRLMEGGDLSIYVEPQKYQKMSKSFLNGKGVQHQMSPAEMAHNEGSGFFKKAKKATINFGKKVGRQVIKSVAPDVAGQFGAVLGGIAPAVLGNPELSPFAAMAGQQMGESAANYLTGMATDALRTHKQRRNAPRSRGTGIDPLLRAGIANKEAEAASAHFEQMRARVRDNQSPFPIVGAHYEKSSIGGSLLHAGQALQSQPYNANFQFRHTLPPAYQEISKRAHGAGLYASSARGLGAGLYGSGLYA